MGLVLAHDENWSLVCEKMRKDDEKPFPKAFGTGAEGPAVPSLDTKLFPFWTSDFLREAARGSASAGNRAPIEDFFPDSLVFCGKI